MRCLLFLLLDILLLIGAYYLSVLINAVATTPNGINNPLTAASLVALLFALFGIYNNIWSFSLTLRDFLLITCLTMAATSGLVLLDILLTGTHLSPAFYLIFMQLSLFFVLGLRLFAYLPTLLRRIKAEKKRSSRLLILGGGAAGAKIIDFLRAEAYRSGRPVAIADDDLLKQGMAVRGVTVAGTCADIPELVRRYKIEEVLFAIPSANEQEKRRIMAYVAETKVRLLTMPSLSELNQKLLTGQPIQLARVNINELLNRDEVSMDKRSYSYLENKTVLVTGGGGSIGSELCRQAALCNIKQLVIFDIYENNAFELSHELAQAFPGLPVSVRVGSVRDKERMDELFNEFKPEVVFHAAAHKHVPLMEDSPGEAIKNNVYGTWNTARAAIEANVERFVLLSTDKAVNPTSIMGATKRMAELIIQELAQTQQKTIFAAVRFGNVLGSNGSVIPLFTKQIERGGPITITHPDITRYFMTIPEASRLVIQAGSLAKGGEIFILDMGDPVRIDDLARKMIRQAGLEPDKDIELRYIGLRPGEKLYEELYRVSNNSHISLTEREKIMVLTTTNNRFRMKKALPLLDKALTAGNEQIRLALAELLPTFRTRK